MLPRSHNQFRGALQDLGDRSPAAVRRFLSARVLGFVFQSLHFSDRKGTLRGERERPDRSLRLPARIGESCRHPLEDKGVQNGQLALTDVPNSNRWHQADGCTSRTACGSVCHPGSRSPVGEYVVPVRPHGVDARDGGWASRRFLSGPTEWTLEMVGGRVGGSCQAPRSGHSSWWVGESAVPVSPTRQLPSRLPARAALTLAAHLRSPTPPRRRTRRRAPCHADRAS